MTVALKGTDVLPLPDCFEPEHAADWHYRPRLERLLAEAEAFRRRHQLAPAGGDRLRTLLLLVDLQKDFCLPEGTLFVGGRSRRGAIEDSRRTAEFIYRNLAHLTEVVCTLDTHHPFQIFFPSFWLDTQGRHPDPHLQLRAEDLGAGRLRPNPLVASWLCDGDQEWLERQVRFYCEQLEAAGKYTLYLWPPHCLLGSDGHSLVGVIEEARAFHAFARGAQNRLEVKGDHPLTENYSVLRPEVLERWDGGALTEPNDDLLERLLAADRLIIAGQAASHCMKSTLEDLLAEIEARDRELAGRVYVLTDCSSSVVVPDPERPGHYLADFTDRAQATLERMAAAGMHLVHSTEPVSAWPGFLR